MGYSDPTLKKLFALSGNQCAFPGCPAPIIDDDTGLVVGEICHIKGKSPKGPRYDGTQSDEERNGYDNLLLMCDPHNKIVDHKETRDNYPPERLRKFKNDHEAPFKRKLSDPMRIGHLNLISVNARYLRHFVNHFRNKGDVDITTFNQSGGQTAYQIVNVYPTRSRSQVSLTPIIESHRTSVDNSGGIDYYAFRVSLRNDSKRIVRSYRLVVEIPWAYADPTHPSSMRDRCEVYEDVTIYTDTEQGHPGFVLYPQRTSEILMNNNYVIRFPQYKDASGTITVNVYFDDELVGHEEFSIAANRNPDRMKQFGLSY